MNIICPHCGADLVETGIIRTEFYSCSFVPEEGAFDAGVFDQEAWECPSCGGDITELIESGLSTTYTL